MKRLAERHIPYKVKSKNGVEYTKYAKVLVPVEEKKGVKRKRK